MPRRENRLSIEFVLLGFVEERPIHGYDLYKQITHFAAISIVWNIKQSQLYALLERLECKGLISSTLIPGEIHPDRKQYQLTDFGRETFYVWRDSPVAHGRDIRLEFLAKLYFALQAGPDWALDLIEKQKTASEEWLNKFQNDLNTVSNEQVYEKMVYRYRISQLEATLGWLNNCRSEIASQIKP